MTEDLSWIDDELYDCDDCNQENRLGQMHGSQQHLICNDCYNGIKELKGNN